MIAHRDKTHKESRTRLYSIWCGMKSRCVSIRLPLRMYYKDRGIIVCKEWKESYEAFRDWAIENGYRDDLELDRRDNNGNYEPTNCRWATRSQQMQNTRKHWRKNSRSKYKGVVRCSAGGVLGKWRAVITTSGKPRHLGVFDDEIRAAKKYDEAAIKQYGEFANLNFAQGGASF